MLLTVKDASELHRMALEYSISEQVENLSDVLGATPENSAHFSIRTTSRKGLKGSSTMVGGGWREVRSGCFRSSNRPWEAETRSR